MNEAEFVGGGLSPETGRYKSGKLLPSYSSIAAIFSALFLLVGLQAGSGPGLHVAGAQAAEESRQLSPMSFQPLVETAGRPPVDEQGGLSSFVFRPSSILGSPSPTATQALTSEAILAPELRLGLLEALQRRAGFTRDQRGPLASPASGDATDSSDLPASWYAGDRVYFAWHQADHEVVFAAFDAHGDTVAAPEGIGIGQWPRIAAEGNRIAVWWERPTGFYGRLYDGSRWGDEFAVPGDVAAMAFAPAGSLYAATSTGLWKLGDKDFERVRQDSYAQPAIAIDAQGNPQVAYQRGGRIVVGGSDLGAGERPTLAFASDGTLYLAYIDNGSLVVRQSHGGGWTAPDPVPAKNPSWPALSASTDGVRLSYLGAADYGPDALWLVRLPAKTPVLVPSLWGNVTEASLIVHFDLRGPRSNYRPHNVQVMVNDIVVGVFTNTVPEGRYVFPLDPNQVFTSNGRPTNNRISITSQHMNPGHYAVNSDYQLIVRTDWAELYGFGSSASEIANAKGIMPVDHDQPDLAVLANSLDLPVEMPTPGPISMAVTVANLGEGTSQPVRLQMLDGKKGLAEAAVPALEAGRQMTVTLPLAYDGKLESVTLHIQQSQPDFDPTNDDLTIHLWAPKITSSTQIGATPSAGQPTPAQATPAQATATVGFDSGIKLDIASWVPKFGYAGSWSAVRFGDSPTPEKKVRSTDSSNALQLPPGTYDVYWQQDSRHDRPVPVASGVSVLQGRFTTVAANSGIKLDIASWVPKFGYAGSWSAVPSGDTPDKRVNWSDSTDPLLLPPGTYDVYWQQDSRHDKPILLASGINVQQGQLVTRPANSGIALQIASWVPGFGFAGSWSAVPSGRTPDNTINWSDSTDPLLLPPGTYDVYWQQDSRHDKPILLVAGVSVRQGQLATQSADSGIKLDIASWVSRFGFAGSWSAVPSGAAPDKRVNWSDSTDPILLPPGQYDIYWQQDSNHDRPMLLVSGVSVQQGRLVTEPAASGIRLSVPAGTPDFGYAGKWGAVRAGDTADKLVNWAASLDPILLPPGNYDIVWQQDANHQPVKLAQSVNVPGGQLVQVTVQPPR